MGIPDFTPEELFLINYAKTHERFDISYDLTCLLPSLAFMAIGVYTEAMLYCVFAFVFIVGFKLREWWYQAKWAPLWKSILEKYEQAIAEASHSSNDR